MAKKTLQQKYQEKKLQETVNRAQMASRFIRENRSDYYARLLIEELSQEDLDKATEVIEKLRKFEDIAKTGNMPTLANALKKAQEEVNKYTGGEGSKMKQNIMGLFSKSKGNNPITKSLALASALEQGLKQIPQVLKNNIKDYDKGDNAKKTLQDLLGSDQKAQKVVSDTLKKAFVPKGIFGKIFGKIPYMENPEKFVAELMSSATPKALAELFKANDAGPQTAEIAQDMQQTIAASGNKGEPTQAQVDVGGKQIDINLGKDPLKPPADKDQAMANLDATKKAAAENEIEPLITGDVLKSLGFAPGSAAAALLPKVLKDETTDFLKGIVKNPTSDHVVGAAAVLLRTQKKTISTHITDILQKSLKQVGKS